MEKKPDEREDDEQRPSGEPEKPVEKASRPRVPKAALRPRTGAPLEPRR